MADFKLRYQFGLDGMQKASADLQAFDKQITGLGKSGSGAGDVFKGMVGADIFQRIAGQASAAGRAVFDFSTKLEQSKVGFETLMGGAANAQRHIEELLKLSRSTGLDFPAIATLSQRLQGAGVQAVKVIPLLKDIGNVAAATGNLTEERLQGIGVAFSQIISKGKVSAEEMEQLAERGVPAWKILSESIGQTTEATRKMAADGKITSDQLSDAFQKFSRMNFGDAMEKQATTFSGAWSVIEANAIQGASKAFEPIYKEVAAFTSKVAKSLKEQEASAKEAGSSFGFAIGEAIGDGIARSNITQTSWWAYILPFQPGGVLYELATSFGRNIGLGVAKGVADASDPTKNFGAHLDRYKEELKKYESEKKRRDDILNPKPVGTTAATGTGKMKRPPKETDDQFRNFFADMGWGGSWISRTQGKSINPGSPHTYAGAADLRTGNASIEHPTRKGGKTIEQIFQLIAKSLEKGYRVVDESGYLPAPGIKRTGPNVHVENAKTSLTKSSIFTNERFSPEQIAYLKHLDKERLGKASGTTGLAKFSEDETEKRKKLEEEAFQNYQDNAERKLEIGQTLSASLIALAEHEYELFVKYNDPEYAMESARQIHNVKIQSYEDEVMALEDLYQASIAGSKEEADYFQKLTIKKIQFEDFKLKAKDEINARRQDLWEKQVRDSEIIINEAIQRLESQMETINPGGGYAGYGSQMMGAIARGHQQTGERASRPWLDAMMSGTGAGSTPSIFGDQGVIKSQADFMKEVYTDVADVAGSSIGSMVDGLAGLAAQWLITGDFSAQAALSMIASTALSIATQAGFKAIFEYAESAKETALALASSAVGDFAGAALHTAAAGAHVAAAKTYLVVAAVAGGVGVGAGLGARALGGGSSSGGGGSSSSSSQGNQYSTTPYSRVSDDAYLSGQRNSDDRLANALERFNDKVETMPAGHVFVAGLRQNRGIIGRQALADVRSGAVRGKDLTTAFGMR